MKVSKTGKVFFYFLLIYPLIFSNLSMIENLPGYSYFAFFSFLPKQIRYLEVILICFFFLRSILYSKRETKKYDVGKIIVIFLLIAIVSSLINRVDVSTFSQATYIFIFPLLIFHIMLNFNLPIDYLEKIIKFIKIILLINLPIIIFEFLYFRLLANYSVVNADDVVTGIFADSQIQAIFFFNAFFLLLGNYFLFNKKNDLIFSIFAFCIAFIGFDEKDTVIVILLTIIMLFLLKQLNIKQIIFGVTIFALVISVINFFRYKQHQENSSLIRFELLKNIDLTKLGPLKAYLNVINIYSESIIYPLVGVGPGTFSSPLVYSKFRGTGKMTQIAEKYNYNMILVGSNSAWLSTNQVMNANIVSALNWNVNNIAGLVIEYGFICFILIFIFYKKLLVKLIRLYKEKLLYKPRLLAVIMMFINLLLLTSITNVENINDIVLISIPIIISAIILNPKNIILLN